MFKELALVVLVVIVVPVSAVLLLVGGLYAFGALSPLAEAAVVEAEVPTQTPALPSPTPENTVTSLPTSTATPEPTQTAVVTETIVPTKTATKTPEPTLSPTVAGPKLTTLGGQLDKLITKFNWKVTTGGCTGGYEGILSMYVDRPNVCVRNISPGNTVDASPGYLFYVVFMHTAGPQTLAANEARLFFYEGDVISGDTPWLSMGDVETFRFLSGVLYLFWGYEEDTSPEARRLFSPSKLPFVMRVLPLGLEEYEFVKANPGLYPSFLDIPEIY